MYNHVNYIVINVIISISAIKCEINLVLYILNGGIIYTMNKLSMLPNIGKTVEQQLNEVGIKTVKQLLEIGSKEAWMKIKSIDNSACINRLYGLEGAIQGIRWHSLSDEVKSELKEFYNTYK